MSDHHEWYRAWRHAELEREARMAANPRFRRCEQIKQMFANAFWVGASVFVFLSIKDAIGW